MLETREPEIEVRFRKFGLQGRALLECGRRCVEFPDAQCLRAFMERRLEGIVLGRSYTWRKDY